MDQDNQDPRYKHRFTRDFTPIPRDLNSMQGLDHVSWPAESHYIRLRIIADAWGNHPADAEEIRLKLYARRAMAGRTDTPGIQHVDGWQSELIQHGLIDLYHAEDGQWYYHIMGFTTAATDDIPRMPTWPTHPNQPKPKTYREYRADKRIARGQSRAAQKRSILKNEKLDSKVDKEVEEEVKKNRCASSSIEVIRHDGQGGYIHPERDGTETPASEMADWAAKHPDNLQSLHNYRAEICKRPYPPADRDAAVARLDAMIAEYHSAHPDGGGVNLGKDDRNLGKDDDDAAAAEGIA